MFSPSITNVPKLKLNVFTDEVNFSHWIFLKIQSASLYIFFLEIFNSFRCKVIIEKYNHTLIIFVVIVDLFFGGDVVSLRGPGCRGFAL